MERCADKSLSRLTIAASVWSDASPAICGRRVMGRDGRGYQSKTCARCISCDTGDTNE